MLSLTNNVHCNNIVLFILRYKQTDSGRKNGIGGFSYRV